MTAAVLLVDISDCCGTGANLNPLPPRASNELFTYTVTATENVQLQQVDVWPNLQHDMQPSRSRQFEDNMAIHWSFLVCSGTRKITQCWLLPRPQAFAT